MWKVKLPDKTQASAELVTALTYKNGIAKYALTVMDKFMIFILYNRYETLRGKAHVSLKAPFLSEATRNAIHDAYSEVQENNRLEHLRSRLLLNAGLCPCCGISSADELDHHLPKSVFKALAIYSSNLVPICHKCNNKKRAITGEVPNKGFIHVYYDNIPENIQFLFAITVIVGQSLVVDFRIEEVPGLDKLLYEQMSFQFDRVNLNYRLGKEINVFMSSFSIALLTAYEGNNAIGVKNFLDQNAKHFQKIYGLNHWRTALLMSLSQHDEFCNGGFIEILGLTP